MNEIVLKNTTLIFLVKKINNSITNICLAYKKRGFGVGRWNGAGGKLDNINESIEQAAIRETKEEIGVQISNIQKVAELNFIFPHQPKWNQLVHVYITDSWQGAIHETEEMKPQWFKIADIPYSNMWPDDIFWLPQIIKGNLIKAHFEFAEGDVITKQNLTVVKSF